MTKPFNLETVIHKAIRTRIDEIIAEESAGIHARVLKRVQAEADAIALQFMSYYEIESRADRVTITVKKGGDNGWT